MRRLKIGLDQQEKCIAKNRCWHSNSYFDPRPMIARLLWTALENTDVTNRAKSKGFWMAVPISNSGGDGP